MKRLLAVLFCLAFAVLPALAAGKDELTLSAALNNPNDGETTWTATGEYLIAAGPFRIGPSVTLADFGTTSANGLGIAGELGIGDKSGLFVGAAVRKITGDAGDLVDYTGEARLGVKFGGEAGFVKLYAAQVWSKDRAGAVSDPYGTAFNVGIGLRF